MPRLPVGARINPRQVYYRQFLQADIHLRSPPRFGLSSSDLYFSGITGEHECRSLSLLISLCAASDARIPRNHICGVGRGFAKVQDDAGAESAVDDAEKSRPESKQVLQWW